VNGVQKVSIDLGKGEAAIDMVKHIPVSELKHALKDHPKYQLTELHGDSIVSENTGVEIRSWLEIYKPVFLVFGYILGITLLVEFTNGEFLWMRWMNHFMAGFFLVFSFFKLLNLQGFAESYAMYDVVAKRWKGWGFAYAIIELVLGLAFLTGYNPILTNAVTFVVMSISVIGVLQSVFNKRKIKCACLGAVFSLPMSTITIIEDALMIAMSGAMLYFMLMSY
jgi:hypothetical protein